MKRLLTALFLLTLIAGCIVPWTRHDQPVAVSGAGGKFTVQAPAGWVQFTLERERVVLTRDGLPVQFIDVALVPNADAFKRIKRSANPSMLPSELAELAVAELRAVPEFSNVVVKETTPARVGGHAGFKLLLQYRSPRGALLTRLVYGAASNEGFLTFSYNAVDRYYFARDLPVFEQVTASYRAAQAR